MNDPITNAVPVHTSIQIAQSREAVWAILADVQRQPEWMHDALSIEVLTEGPIGVGSRMKVPTQILFFRTTDIMEVTAFAPPEKWTVVHRGLVTGEGTFTLTESEDKKSTRVDWHERLAAPWGPLGRLGMTLMRPALRAQFQGNLERFRVLCESESPTPAP